MVPESLYEKPPSKIVLAFDLFNNKIKRNLKNFRFRVSVYGILENNGKILLNRHPLLKQFGLPGGGIKIGEKISDALKREFFEETGLKVKPYKLTNVDENLFTDSGKDAHGILLFYKVKLLGGKIKTNEEDSAEVKWFIKKNLSSEIVHRYSWSTIKKLIDNS